MGEKPFDPAGEQIEQADRHENSMTGQQGYGVQFEAGQFQNAGSETTPPGGRSGSYESQNQGGYGADQTEANDRQHPAGQASEENEQSRDSPRQRNRHLDQGPGA